MPTHALADLSNLTAETTVASAGTTDIGAVASDKVSITGTTTITSFGTKAAGAYRQGRFTGALTLTHNATSLILPGGANITTAAGDRFQAYSLGSGNWVVTSYTKADGTAVVGGAGASGANPTASVGLTAVNGVASTFLRSDGAPALDVAIAPTWSGNHVYSKNSALSLPTIQTTGEWITGGTATTTKPHVLVEPTGTTSTGWSTAGTGIGANGASGFLGNLMDLQLAGVSKFTLSYNGIITIPGNLYCSSIVSTGEIRCSSGSGIYWLGRSYFLSPVDGQITCANNAQTDFTRLNLGGTTSSFPALARSGTSLVQQLADGTAGGGLTVSLPLAKVGGCIEEFFADVGTPTDATETDLYSFTTIANTLANNGEKLTALFVGTFTLHASHTTNLRVYFAGTSIFASGALTLATATTWRIEVDIIRVSSTVVRCCTTLTTLNTTSVPLTSYIELTGRNLATTNILKLTGQNGGTNPDPNDAVAKFGSIYWQPVG